MKKIFTYLASAALVLAASCNKMEEVNTPVDTTTPVETETITVQLNPATKTSLNTDGKTTKWTSGDKVSVTVDGKNIGTLTLVEGNIFSGEVEAGHDGKAILNYPVDNDNKAVTTVPGTQVAKENTFAVGAALLEGETTMDALRAGEGAHLSNKTALLSFVSTLDGDVMFKVGNASYTVKNCKANKTHYVCVAPVDNAALSYTVASKEGAKSKNGVTFEAGKVYPLGAILPKFIPELGYTYLQVTDEWKSDNARFAAYFFMNGTTGDCWKNLDLVAGQINIYGCKVPGAFNSVIFCRMNGTATENKWDNKWNQTVDLDLSKNSIFSITNPWNEASEGKATGTWTGNSAVDNNLYLNPNSNWKADNARFAAYFFGNGEKWVSMSDSDKDGIYEVAKPTDKTYPNVIFCRMNPSASANNWDNKWNQTGDLTIPTDGKNLYTVKAGTWDKGGGEWSVKN